MSIEETQEKKIPEIRHEIVSMAQMFHSYAELSKNESFHLSPKKIHEICHRCALRCRELGQILLEIHNNQEEKK